MFNEARQRTGRVMAAEDNTAIAGREALCAWLSEAHACHPPAGGGTWIAAPTDATDPLDATAYVCPECGQCFRRQARPAGRPSLVASR